MEKSTKTVLLKKEFMELLRAGMGNDPGVEARFDALVSALPDKYFESLATSTVEALSAVATELDARRAEVVAEKEAIESQIIVSR